MSCFFEFRRIFFTVAIGSKLFFIEEFSWGKIADIQPQVLKNTYFPFSFFSISLTTFFIYLAGKTVCRE
jgi:hypothetical protein